MTRYHSYFSPYFNSTEFQESHEREVEKKIEYKIKYGIYLITRIWRRPSKKLKNIIHKIKTEDKELFDRLKDQ